MNKTPFIDFDICHCKSYTEWPWPIFLGTKFEILVSQKKWELAQTCEITLNKGSLPTF